MERGSSGFDGLIIFYSFQTYIFPISIYLGSNEFMLINFLFIIFTKIGSKFTGHKNIF